MFDSEVPLVPVSSYLQLLDANEAAPWAEELAWYAASASGYSDECYPECRLGEIQQRPFQYWIRFPRGPHIAEALKWANEEVRYPAEAACTGSDEYTMIGPETTKQIRDGLSKVTHPLKQELLKSLDEIDRKCANKPR